MSVWSSRLTLFVQDTLSAGILARDNSENHNEHSNGDYPRRNEEGAAAPVGAVTSAEFQMGSINDNAVFSPQIMDHAAGEDAVFATRNVVYEGSRTIGTLCVSDIAASLTYLSDRSMQRLVCLEMRNLIGIHGSTEAWQGLCSSVREAAPCLKVFKLRDLTTRRHDGFEEFMREIFQKSTLEELELLACYVGRSLSWHPPADVFANVCHMSHIFRLNLSGAQIDDDSVVSLCEALLDKEHLIFLSFSTKPVLRDPARCGTALGMLVERTSSLQSLSVWAPNKGQQLAFSLPLINALSVNSTISEVYLRNGERPSFAGCPKFLRAADEMIEKNYTLLNMTVGLNETLTPFVEFCLELNQYGRGHLMNRTWTGKVISVDSWLRSITHAREQMISSNDKLSVMYYYLVRHPHVLLEVNQGLRRSRKRSRIMY